MSLLKLILHKCIFIQLPHFTEKECFKSKRINVKIDNFLEFNNLAKYAL
jgi:hypothetical protein